MTNVKCQINESMLNVKYQMSPTVRINRRAAAAQRAALQPHGRRAPAVWRLVTAALSALVISHLTLI
jgi:hypothetical protein